MADNNLDAFKNNAEEKTTADDGRKLKIGIIGTGWIAGSHIVEYMKMPDVEIVAGADLVPGKAEEFFKKYGVEGARCYPDHKSMLDAEAFAHTTERMPSARSMHLKRASPFFLKSR